MDRQIIWRLALIAFCGCSASQSDHRGAAPARLSGNAHRFCGWLMPTGMWGFDTLDQDPYIQTFRNNASKFDAVHPTWYDVRASDGQIVPTWHAESPFVLAGTTRAGQPTKLIPMIAVQPGPQAQRVRAIIADDPPGARSQHVEAIVALVTNPGAPYDGIDLDYEGLAEGVDWMVVRDNLIAFAEELGTRLHSVGKTLSLAVQVPYVGNYFDYDRLSAAADHLHVMAYDFHYFGGPHVGPISPLSWVQQSAVGYITSNFPDRLSKFILGLPNYGLGAATDTTVVDWATQFDLGMMQGNNMRAITLTGGVYDVTTTHTDPGVSDQGRAPNQWVNIAGVGMRHIYFDDIDSLEQRVIAAASGALGGITYWSIGGEPNLPGPRTFFDMVRAHFP